MHRPLHKRAIRALLLHDGRGTVRTECRRGSSAFKRREVQAVTLRSRLATKAAIPPYFTCTALISIHEGGGAGTLQALVQAGEDAHLILNALTPDPAPVMVSRLLHRESFGRELKRY